MADYDARYSVLSSEELLSLAAQEESLVDAARSALQAELTRRGLQNSSLGQYQEQSQKQIDTAVRNSAPVVEGKWVTAGAHLFWPLQPSVSILRHRNFSTYSLQWQHRAKIKGCSGASNPLNFNLLELVAGVKFELTTFGL